MSNTLEPDVDDMHVKDVRFVTGHIERSTQVATCPRIYGSHWSTTYPNTDTVRTLKASMLDLKFSSYASLTSFSRPSVPTQHPASPL